MSFLFAFVLRNFIMERFGSLVSTVADYFQLAVQGEDLFITEKFFNVLDPIQLPR